MELNVMIRYSQFSAKAIENVIRTKYEMNQLISCRFFDNGLNDIYKITTVEQTYFFRISLANMHSKKDYEEEIAAIFSFAKEGIPVAKPISMLDGTYLLEFDAPEGKRYGVLFEEAKELISTDEDIEARKLKKLGEALAKIHRCADQKGMTLTRGELDVLCLRDLPLKKIAPYLKHRMDDYKYLTDASGHLIRRIEETQEKIPPFYGVCHGDLHSGNVRFYGDEPMIFDFDCMGYGYRMYDICVYAWNESYQEEDYLQSKQWKAFLDGYETILPLAAEEKETLPVFMALRQLWLMGLHADVMDKNAGCCWYNDSYFDEQIKLFKRYESKIV